MLHDKVLKTIDKFNLLSPIDKVLVGVSGGPDSLALLFILNELKAKLSIKIIVAHLNHGLRGKSSDFDEKFVRDITSSLYLDFFSKRVSWPASKLKRANEEELRKLRYGFLFNIAKKYGIKKIALAHTLDDQAETVLMRLIRGTGLYGLISILPKRKINNFVIIRPLIEISKAEVHSYLNKIKVKPRIDKTNLSQNFLRNKLRHGILKDLSKINPNIKQTLARFAQQAAVDYDYLYQKSKRLLKTKNNRLVKIDLKKFRNLHIALQRMAIRVALEKITGELRTFTYKHWEEIQDLVNARPYSSTVYITKEVRVKKDKKNIILYLDKRQ